MLSYLLFLAIGLMGIGFIIFLHELGHFIAARLLFFLMEWVQGFSLSMAGKQSTGFQQFHSEATAA